MHAKKDIKKAMVMQPDLCFSYLSISSLLICRVQPHCQVTTSVSSTLREMGEVYPVEKDKAVGTPSYHIQLGKPILGSYWGC